MTIFRTGWFGPVVAPVTGPVTVKATSVEGTAELKVQVCTGDELGNLNVVASATGAEPSAAFTATQGVIYHVQVGVTSDVHAEYKPPTWTGPVPPEQPPAPTSGTLPWDVLSKEVLRASGVTYTTHYYPAMPLKINNKPPDSDYWQVYLSRNGENNKFLQWGGWVGDRPVKVPAFPSTTVVDQGRSLEGWRVEAAKIEVRQMIDQCIDVAWQNIMSYPTSTGDTQQVKVMRAFMAACKLVDPGFKHAPMVDTNGIGTRTVAQVASLVGDMMAHPSSWRLPDGRKVLGSFKAEGRSVSWWKQLIAALNAKGHQVAFVAVFLNANAYRDAYAPITWAQSEWGDAHPNTLDPNATGSTSRVGRGLAVKAKGQKWMAPIRFEEERRRESWFVEAVGTLTLRRCFEIARKIGSALLQGVTWCDYTEGTQLAPSHRGGPGKGDLITYEVMWAKTGSPPAIKRDGCFVTHRVQKWAATPQYVPSAPMKLKSNTTPAVDIVEVQTFLTAPATVTVTVGSTTHPPYQAPAGRYIKNNFPLAVGKVSVLVQRNGVTLPGPSGTSPYPVVSKPPDQDLMYRCVNMQRV